MRVRKIKDLSKKLIDYQHLLIEDPKEIKKRFDEKPLELEIGFGKGDFLIAMAKKYPERNFLGIERSGDFTLKAMRDVGELKNILFMTGNIQEIIPLMEENLFSGLYLNFSDPWPKARHFKRRLTYRVLLMSYQRILKKASIVQLKTDSRELFEFSLQQVKALGKTPFDVTEDLHNDPLWSENIATHYEIKFSTKGKKILGFRYRS
ncbi:MAG: tRNA (guanosine(46)-N7)-methyltransferase TrmB [Tissierellia bacterium]|jgi:tRNA (guanine-N7-)-methyltransferase|nr:tRNA (guanosine(46)-N7)-methyltransferase TrmB [Tissierellia bacterium]